MQGVFEKSLVYRRSILDVLHFTETTHYAPDGGSSCCAVHPGTSSHSLAADLAVPDANNLPLHGILSTENTGAFAVLGDFDLLHHLT